MISLSDGGSIKVTWSYLSFTIDLRGLLCSSEQVGDIDLLLSLSRFAKLC